jgi:hypothetical protein
MNQLPGILAEIADIAGEDAALAVAAARGGTQSTSRRRRARSLAVAPGRA